MQELDLAVGAVGEEQTGLDRAGDREPDGAADQRTEHTARRGVAQTAFRT